MADIERQIEELTKQLAELRNRQLQLNDEFVLLEKQLESLKNLVQPHPQPQSVIEKPADEIFASSESQKPYIDKFRRDVQNKPSHQQNQVFHINTQMEDFIGTNVISKIGILVTIIGVFIGAKYAIDNELVSPFIRIMAGYCMAAALVIVAVRLKKKYEYFSSVLTAGGLAVAYFITYIAFSFYGLLPMWLAFVAMIIITGASVGIALWYNQKVIALIGQVAAYAIPFLLGNKSGNVFGLFAYISLINIGLLVLSFKKEWKLLYHIAFFLTWSIYLFWLFTGTQVSKKFSAGLFFLTATFFTFYITFLSYKIFKKEQYRLGEIGILLLNALFYFFLGVFLIEENFQNIHFLTWFTIANAFLHFAAGYCIYRLKLADTSVFQFVTGLGLLFFTIAIPIELDGSWVTLLWTVEATTLFYIATANHRHVYLEIAFPLVIIAVLSLIQDWSDNYSYLSIPNVVSGFSSTPFANVGFWLSMFVCGCIGYMAFSAQKTFSGIKPFIAIFFNKVVPLTFLFLVYFAFYNEIDFAWHNSITRHELKHVTYRTKQMEVYRSLTLIIFSCLYFATWLFINERWVKKESLHHLLLLMAAIVNVIFLARGLYLAGELRENYLKAASGNFGTILFVRYLSFAGLAFLWLSIYSSMTAFRAAYSLQVAFSSFFNLTFLTVISNEFIQWMDFAGYQNQYKLGLSLICGAYALTLIFFGIIKKKKHLRISAMVLFGITLLKLFFYDLASLSTISKTIVLVLLGILLLFASFLYNKYKDFLSGKEEV
ncbi:DUF2339 domain-containing protein [Segetibacter koreensis]|uniref:DUF2339 domain-containing protein n=1 Tax=Segetibacter koreensis TaxID=398037 RepID=UPI0003A35857|nr:DUF2339 domain-containing protein [Segetibacter koreensis]